MMDRLLITGAAGGLGAICRTRLRHMARTLRLSDKSDMDPAGDGEEVVPCDLADAAAVHELVAGCDGIVHLGGKSIEGTFAEILNANIVGTYNVYEAARKNGVKRILFASSNHAIGFHTRETRLDAGSPIRPDSNYGVSKCYGEALGSLYFDKYGIETAAVRIGSCFEAPKDHRMLATWLSPDDFVALIERVFFSPRLGFAIVYGVSDNEEQWWDNRHAAYLGWRPKDSSERFRAGLDAAMKPLPSDDPATVYQGGTFAKAGHFED